MAKTLKIKKAEPTIAAKPVAPAADGAAPAPDGAAPAEIFRHKMRALQNFRFSIADRRPKSNLHKNRQI